MDRYRAGMVLAGCCAVLGMIAGAQTEQARKFWEKGQAAMQAELPDRAIGFYEASLRADPTFTDNHLSLAAAYLEKGDDLHACLHLAHYLDAHPAHHIIRTHYAELLLRVGRFELARIELKRFLLDTEDREDLFAPEWVHCHRRLMEIALAGEDAYHARLHKGIALYLMAQQLLKLPDDDGDVATESLLFKAAGELTTARILDRDKARPCWYLHLAWSKLGQSKQSRRFLREARDRAPCNDLTPGETRSLLLSLDD